jgi:hypothetical protein
VPLFPWDLWFVMFHFSNDWFSIFPLQCCWPRCSHLVCQCSWWHGGCWCWALVQSANIHPNHCSWFWLLGDSCPQSCMCHTNCVVAIVHCTLKWDWGWHGSLWRLIVSIEYCTINSGDCVTHTVYIYKGFVLCHAIIFFVMILPPTIWSRFHLQQVLQCVWPNITSPYYLSATE